MMPHSPRYLLLVPLAFLAAACAGKPEYAPAPPVQPDWTTAIPASTTTTVPHAHLAGDLCHDSTGYPYRTERCPT